MDSFRRHHYTRLCKVVAFALSLLLLQTLGAALLHVTFEEHTYCESHQAFEHVDSTTGEASHDSAHAETTDDSHLPSEDAEESCNWLTWLQGPTVPLPQLHASLLNIPPPLQAAVVQPRTRHQFIPSQIDLLRLSPGHSPPAVADISV